MTNSRTYRKTSPVPGRLSDRALATIGETSLADGLRLRRMGLQDLPWVVSEHRLKFPDGFFARLGSSYLTRYYRTFLDGPTATALIVEDEHGQRGYLVGVLRPQRHRNLVMQHHGFGLARSGAWGLIKHPSLAVTFARTRVRRYLNALRSARRRDPDERRDGRGRSAVLTHVAVADDAQGDGIGTALVDQFLGEAEAAGCARALLVTVVGVAGAGNYYEHRGWHELEVTSTNERTLSTYEIELVTPTDAARV